MRNFIEKFNIDHINGSTSWQVNETCRILVEECTIQGVVNPDHVAYILATLAWETNHTFMPIEEAYWLTKDWHMKHLYPKYGMYWGRGYVQLTWKANYEKFAPLVHSDLINEPDLAKYPPYAMKILVLGMRDGLFTGHSLAHHTDKRGNLDFVRARNIVNGSDKAHIIASMAQEYKG